MEGGSANDYDYCWADPVNCNDLSGALVPPPVEAPVVAPVLVGIEIGRRFGTFLRHRRDQQGQFRRQLGGRKGDGCEAHHIVAISDRRAARSRQILNGAGIGVNDPRNGVLIGKQGHQQLHTNGYHAEVTSRLGASPNTDYVLGQIGGELQARYPCGS